MLALSTIPFSSFEYGMVEWCRTLKSVAYPSCVAIINCEPQSVIIFSGVPKRQKCRHNASVASSAITFFVGKSSTYLVKVSMMTNMYLNWCEISRGPIVSSAIHRIGCSVERTNLDALIALCLVAIFLHVAQLKMYSLTSWRRVGHAPAAVLLGWYCVNIVNVRSTPLCAHSHSWHSLISCRCGAVHPRTSMWCIIIVSTFSTRRLNTSTGMFRSPGTCSMIAM